MDIQKRPVQEAAQAVELPHQRACWRLGCTLEPGMQCVSCAVQCVGCGCKGRTQGTAQALGAEQQRSVQSARATAERPVDVPKAAPRRRRAPFFAQHQLTVIRQHVTLDSSPRRCFRALDRITAHRDAPRAPHVYVLRPAAGGAGGPRQGRRRSATGWRAALALAAAPWGL